MEIEAIYDRGRLRLPKGLRLRREHFPLRIEIPDEEIETEPPAEAAAATAAKTGEERPSSFLAELNTILAPVRQQLESSGDRPLSKEDRQDLFYQEWQERHRDGG